MKAKIYVSIKKDVLDPQGAVIANSLKMLGFDEVKDVRQGKFIEVSLATSDKAVAEKMVADMCEKLLVNKVIEEYSFTLEQLVAS